MNMRTIITTLILAGLSATAGSAADAKAGKAIFDRSCKSCHGPDGTPNPSMAKMMKVEMRDLKSPEVQGVSDDEMKKIITEGKGKMPAVKTVSGADLDNLIAYIRSLKK
jgi:mono/diheme cytochrome c family protein